MRLYAPDRHGLAQVASVRGNTLEATYVEFAPSTTQQPLNPGYVLSTLAPPPVPLTPKLDELRYPPPPRCYEDSEANANQPPSGPADIADLRRSMGLHDWILLEISRQLRKSR
jgi:hypothetical protein